MGRKNLIKQTNQTNNHIDVEERASCFAWFVFQVSRNCCVALPRGAMGLSAIYDCVIS